MLWVDSQLEVTICQQLAWIMHFKIAISSCCENINLVSVQKVWNNALFFALLMAQKAYILYNMALIFFNISAW